ncbi:epimerase [Planotetraspora thailandica]|uniref:Epimerase n=1 Tax=Planotetraspora thailandica TaxID=487172 RepID=A0A8J3V1I0_9ACTN|nr:NAD-dependent epimerase/dehydratase family protein [Planotetraspora thailandica]GII52349.1 epimerase [Planotetraspora thailandica]
MKVIVFGATGMIGQGVLRECLVDPAVEEVLVVGRRSAGQRHAKLREVIYPDFSDFSALAEEFSRYDACFFCLGVSSVGMSEDAYRRVTYDITLAAATVMAERNPAMTFVYVSGEGSDSSERGRVMWARVRGRTENALLRLPFHAYVIRLGYVQPLYGVASKTRWYRGMYAVVAPAYPLLRRLLPRHVTTTENVGKAMLALARRGTDAKILYSRDVNAAAA